MLHSRVRRFYILSGKRITYFYLRTSLFYFDTALKSLSFFLDYSMCLREVSILGSPLRMGMLGLLAQLAVLISTMLLMLRYLWKYAVFSIYSKAILFSTSTSRHLLINSLSSTLT
jgi:hypothetical protein